MAKRVEVIGTESKKIEVVNKRGDFQYSVRQFDERIAKITSLLPGWIKDEEGDHGEATSEAAIQELEEFRKAIIQSFTKVPRVFPEQSGGIEFVWEDQDYNRTVWRIKRDGSHRILRGTYIRKEGSRLDASAIQGILKELELQEDLRGAKIDSAMIAELLGAAPRKLNE